MKNTPFQALHAHFLPFVPFLTSNSNGSCRGPAGAGGGSLRRSPLDVIMSQIRRKRSASDRKPLGRFLSWSSDRTGTPESAEPEPREEGGQGPGDVMAALEGGRHGGCHGDWGAVSAFLQRFGPRAGGGGGGGALSLAHCQLTATDLLELGTLVPRLPGLQELDVSWNPMVGGALEALTAHLGGAGGVGGAGGAGGVGGAGGLRRLRLCSCRLNGDDVNALGAALPALPHLELLDVSWNGAVGGGASAALLGNLPPALRELHLVACGLTPPDAAALGKGAGPMAGRGRMEALTHLGLLDLSWNPGLGGGVASGGVASVGGVAMEGGGGFGVLAASLSHAHALGALRLQACGLTADSLDAIGASLARLPAVTQLDLSRNKRLSGGLGRLTPHLAHLESLESLDLHLCGLTPDDFEALIQVLPSLTALAHLDVSANQALGGVAWRLVSALPLKQMRKLSLSQCSLTAESCSTLALAAPHLHSLDVSWNKALGGRVAALLGALQPCVLRELRVSSCQLTDQDLQLLAGACGRGLLSSLRLLDVSFNGSVGVAGWAALMAAGGGLGGLRELDLSRRPLTPAPCSPWLPALLRALPKMAALVRLALWRWTANPPERQRLEQAAAARQLRLEWDAVAMETTDAMDTMDDWKPANQERRPEE